MKNVLTICSFVFVSSSLLLPNSAVGQSLEKCLRSFDGRSSECEKYRLNGGINEDNKFFGLTAIEVNSHSLHLFLGRENKKNDVIKGIRKLCGNMELKEYRDSDSAMQRELWELESPHPVSPSVPLSCFSSGAKSFHPGCAARNLPKTGYYEVVVKRYSGECKK